MGYIFKTVLGIFLPLLLRRITQFGNDFNWKKYKADAVADVRRGIPGTWFDDEGALLCSVLIDAAEAILSSGNNLQRIVDLVVDGNFEGAAELLKDLVLGQFRVMYVGATPVSMLIDDDK